MVTSSKDGQIGAYSIGLTSQGKHGLSNQVEKKKNQKSSLRRLIPQTRIPSLLKFLIVLSVCTSSPKVAKDMYFEVVQVSLLRAVLQ
jgi:hypothetical protein